MAKKLSLIDNLRDLDDEDSILNDTTTPKVPNKPDIPEGPDTVEQGESNITYYVDSVDHATDYLWSLSPEKAGKVKTNKTEYIIDFNDDYSGSAKIKVKALIKNTQGEWSDSKKIEIRKKSTTVNEVKGSDKPKKTKPTAPKEEPVKKSLNNEKLTTINMHNSMSLAIDKMRIFGSDYSDRKNGKRLFIERIIVKEFEKQFGKTEAKKLKESTGYPELLD